MKVRKYQSESRLQCPKPEGWACKKPKNLKMIDSANKLSGFFDRRKRCSRSTLRWGKAPSGCSRCAPPPSFLSEDDCSETKGLGPVVPLLLVPDTYCCRLTK